MSDLLIFSFASSKNISPYPWNGLPMKWYDWWACFLFFFWQVKTSMLHAHASRYFQQSMRKWLWHCEFIYTNKWSWDWWCFWWRKSNWRWSWSWNWLMEAIHAAFHMVIFHSSLLVVIHVLFSIMTQTIIALGSTINYGNELPLAQGINFGQWIGLLWGMYVLSLSVSLIHILGQYYYAKSAVKILFPLAVLLYQKKA